MIAAKGVGPRAASLPARLLGDFSFRGALGTPKAPWWSLKALGNRELHKDIKWGSGSIRLAGSNHAYLRDYYHPWAFSMGPLYNISVNVVVRISFTKMKFRSILAF